MSADDGVMSPPLKRPLPVESPHQGTTPKKQKTKEEKEEEKVRKDAEKEEKRLAREMKQRENELKAKAKEDEKKRKQEESDKKAKAKEDEKRRKQEEIDKKERVRWLLLVVEYSILTLQAQLRLGSFFTPKPTSKAIPIDPSTVAAVESSSTS
jgi:archaellum component FlaD/FlaE